MTSDFRPQVEI